MKNKKTIPVKIEVLEVIYSALIPCYYRVNSLVDHYQSSPYPVSDLEKAGLFEAAACSITLKTLLEEYFEQTKDLEEKLVYLPRSEFQTIIELARVVESSQKVSFFGTTLSAH